MSTNGCTWACILAVLVLCGVDATRIFASHAEAQTGFSAAGSVVLALCALVFSLYFSLAIIETLFPGLRVKERLTNWYAKRTKKPD